MPGKQDVSRDQRAEKTSRGTREVPPEASASSESAPPPHRSEGEPEKRLMARAELRDSLHVFVSHPKKIPTFFFFCFFFFFFLGVFFFQMGVSGVEGQSELQLAG